MTEEEGPGHSHLPHTTALSPPHSEGVLSTQVSSPPPLYLAQDTDSAHATSPAVQAATSTGATHLAEAHFEPEMAVVLQEVADLLATQEHSHSSGQLPASTSTASESGGGSPRGPSINDPPVWSVHAAKECARKMRLLGVPERLLGRLLAALTEPNYNIGPEIMGSVDEMLECCGEMLWDMGHPSAADNLSEPDEQLWLLVLPGGEPTPHSPISPPGIPHRVMAAHRNAQDALVAHCLWAMRRIYHCTDDEGQTGPMIAAPELHNRQLRRISGGPSIDLLVEDLDALLLELFCVQPTNELELCGAVAFGRLLRRHLWHITQWLLGELPDPPPTLLRQRRPHSACWKL